MDLQEARKLLNGCVRHELRDHAFGDTEVYWVKGTREIATGYFGSGSSDISIFHTDADKTGFVGDEAQELRNCGKLGEVERNDETGPDEYAEGRIMPGLTLEGVREELTS